MPSMKAETPNPAVTPAPNPAPSTISLLPPTTAIPTAAVVILGIPLNPAPVLPTIAAGLLPEAVLVVQTILMNLHPRVMQI